MAISNIWTIQGAAGSPTSFEARNLLQPQASHINQAADTFTFAQSTDYDADPEFAYGEIVTIYRDSVKWFQGILIDLQRRGTGSAERINYILKGPWWQLEQIIYQQQYTRFVGGVTATPTLAKLILGTDDAGSRLNSGQVITAVVNYAAAALGANALFQIGTVEVATEMPYEELNALSCAEVIKRALRWNPDTVVSLDYTTTPATLNFQSRASLPSLSYAIADVLITENSINPRNDLQKDGVVIQYERTDTIDGNEQKVIITDTAGTVTNPLKTLYLFFDLQGSSVSFVRQKVVSATIQQTSGTWWAKRHPKLKNITGTPTISNATKEAVDDTSEGGEDDGTSYAKELISGSIADWMTGVGTNAQIITADVTYTPTGGTARTETLRLQVVGTNAGSQTYSTVGNTSPAEPTPTGLAAAILASINTLQYEGTLTLTQEDIPAAAILPNKLNITGGRTEWASMDAQIYGVDYDLSSGRTTIKFGPAKHLGASDLFQLLRNVRTRRGSSGSLRTGTNGGQSDLPTRSPNTTTADDGGGAAADGFQFYWVDGTTSFVSMATALAGRDTVTPEDEWGIFVNVTNNAFLKTWTFGAGTSGVLWNDTGTAQTYWYIPIYAGGKRLALGGAYKAEVNCANGDGPVAALIQIA